MSNYSVITLLDASLFSALSYAPINTNAITYGFAQGSENGLSNVNYIAAQALASNGWTDQTQTLIDTFTKGAKVFDTTSTLSGANNALNDFRVFVNSTTHQVVFAFKGSSLNPNNWISDITTSDQGYTQYAAIEAAAEALYTSMTDPGSQYSSYQFFADGHSLGGGMAQTFALQNDISGFGQNALPIAPSSQANSSGFFSEGFTTALSNYATSGAAFQELNMQGDIASASFGAYFTGGYYLDSGLTKWLHNDDASAELSLANLALSTSTSTLKGKYTWAEAVAGLLADAGTAHTLAAFIPAALQQIGPSGGVGFVGATPDSSALQQAIGEVVEPVLNAIQSAGLTANVNGSISIGLSWLGIPITIGVSAGGVLQIGSGDVQGVAAGAVGVLSGATGNTSQTTVLKGTPGTVGTDVLMSTAIFLDGDSVSGGQVS
jgi:hypothetical protein